MKKNEHINKWMEEALNSVDNIKRAEALPFLLTRVNARLNKTTENRWEKAILFIGRPAIAIPGLLLLIFINVMAIVFTRTGSFAAATEQSMQPTNDEFTYTVSTIYDIENTEP